MVSGKKRNCMKHILALVIVGAFARASDQGVMFLQKTAQELNLKTGQIYSLAESQRVLIEYSLNDETRLTTAFANLQKDAKLKMITYILSLVNFQIPEGNATKTTREVVEELQNCTTSIHYSLIEILQTFAQNMRRAGNRETEERLQLVRSSSYVDIAKPLMYCTFGIFLHYLWTSREKIGNQALNYFYKS